MDKKLVSVLMSTYNEPEEWINKSIESILNQSYKNIELLVVCDNPNNEEIVNILNSFAKKDNRIKIILNEVNMGLAKSLNRALELANGEYIARMDSDDIALDRRIETQINYLDENSLDLVGSGVICIDEKEKEIAELNNFPTNDVSVRKRIIYNNCIAHPTWLGKKEVFKSNKGYREVPYAEDYDFILRALDNGFKLGNIKEILLKYRIRSSSISNKNGLKQFLISQELVRNFKIGNINNDISIISKEIDDVLISVTKVDEECYYNASTNFTSGIMKIKKFNITGIALLFKSILGSSYYRKKIKCYIKGIL